MTSAALEPAPSGRKTIAPSQARTEAAIYLRDVEMKFGSQRALREGSFFVPPGGLCGLIGPNGAGKTTTLRLVVGDLRPTEGEVRVLGHDFPKDANQVRSRVGYMPDRAELYEELTLGEYLDFFAAFYGFRKEARARAVKSAMDLAGTKAFADRRLKGLSKGEKQRVLLSRTLIQDPDLLVLDEPADGLDPRGRVELRELLLLLHERGKTILISSHILADLEEICTHLVLMNQGRVVFHGNRHRLRATGVEQARIAIEVLDDPAALIALLGARPELSVGEPRSGRVEVECPADPVYAHGLLKDLLGAGVRVSSFARSTESLEELYLRLTEHGEVAE